jgi:ketosteroid isomerase-like protein
VTAVTAAPDHRSLFAAIDAMDAAAFARYLTEDAVFQFGNVPAVRGRAAIEAFVAQFFSALAAVEHRLEAAWTQDGRTTCHGTVTYTRHDGSTLTVPFANVLYCEGGRVARYLIYIDNSALFGAAGSA